MEGGHTNNVGNGLRERTESSVHPIRPDGMIGTMTQVPHRMTYDPEADAAYIYITDPIEPGASVKNGVLTHDLAGTAIVGDFDDEEHLLGIELLGVARLLGPGTLPT